MSDGVPLPTNAALDAQTFEDLLRELTLDQWPRFPPIVEHIYPHFIKQSPEVRRGILTWLREVIESRSQNLKRTSPTSFDAQTCDDLEVAQTQMLSNINTAVLTVMAEINNAPWLIASEDDYPTKHPIANLGRFSQFTDIWGGVIYTERCNNRQLDSISKGIFSEDVQINLIRRMSHRVLIMYGFDTNPKPKVNDAIQRIQYAYLAFSITEKARAVLNPNKLKRYECVLKHFMQMLKLNNLANAYSYSLVEEISFETFGVLSKILEPHEQLLQLLREIPWYHLQEVESPKTDEPDWSTWGKK